MNCAEAQTWRQNPNAVFAVIHCWRSLFSLLPQASAAQTGTSLNGFEPASPADINVIPQHLQMSAFAQDVSTGAPPMFGAASAQDATEPPPESQSDVPSFMQPGHRAPAPAVESVELISANDLPDWIRQIAAADAEKARAEEDAQMAANMADAPQSIIRRQLPGETVIGAPSTNWLSKKAGSEEGSEHWGTSEVASANWGTYEAPVQPAAEAYPTSIPATAFVPTVREQPKLAKKRRLSRGGSSSAAPSSVPIYRNPVVQLTVALVLLALVALLFVV